MTRAYEEEEIALPLLRRSAPSARIEAEEDISEADKQAASRVADRVRPGTAGALTGLLAGAAGLGVVHALHQSTMGQGIARLGASLDLPPDASVPLAYLAAALGGAVVGAGFATVTRHLRRSFIAVFVWALVFFVSVTMLVLAISSAYGRGIGVSMAPAILLASAAYSFIVSFQLPLRLRRRG